MQLTKVQFIDKCRSLDLKPVFVPSNLPGFSLMAVVVKVNENSHSISRQVVSYYFDAQDRVAHRFVEQYNNC